MGRRTLVVSQRADDRFDCRYAHWGLAADPIAQSRPLATGWSAEAVLAELDASYERVLVRGAVPRQYCVCWLDPTLADTDDIAFARASDPDTLREWWTTAKSDASERVAAGLSPTLVRDWLLARLDERAVTVYGADDASFLFADR